MQTVSRAVDRTARLNVEAINAMHRGALINVLLSKGIPANELDDAYQSLMVIAIQNAHSYDPTKGASEYSRVAIDNMQTLLDERHNRGAKATARKQQLQEVSYHIEAGEADEEDGLLETSFAGIVEDAHSDPVMRLQLSQYMEALYAALTPTEQTVLEFMGLDLLQGNMDQEDYLACAEAHGWRLVSARMHVSHIRAKARTLWAEHFDIDLTKPTNERIVVTH